MAIYSLNITLLPKNNHSYNFLKMSDGCFYFEVINQTQNVQNIRLLKNVLYPNQDDASLIQISRKISITIFSRKYHFSKNDQLEFITTLLLFCNSSNLKQFDRFDASYFKERQSLLILNKNTKEVKSVKYLSYIYQYTIKNWEN